MAGLVKGAEPTLRLAVDATWLPLDNRGMGRYVRSVVEQLLQRPELEVVLASRSERDEPLLRRMFDGRAFSFAPWPRLRLARPDVAWFPWNRVDVDPGAPVVVTVYDTAAFDWPLPGLLRWLDNRRAQGQLRTATARAARVTTISQFSADCIGRHLGVPAERIDIIGAGVDAGRFVPSPGPVPEAAGRSYALFVGALDPRKNLQGLLEAWARLGSARGDCALLVVGCDLASAQQQLGALRLDQVIFAGKVADERLATLYTEAALFVMPSSYEGFGLPVLEAMACGTPVASSRGASLPEVGGTAVVTWFDPGDPAEMAQAVGEALARVTSEPEAYRLRGLRHAATFTWERVTERLLHSLRQAARASR